MQVAYFCTDEKSIGLHTSPVDPKPHITIMLLKEADLPAAQSGNDFGVVNVHLYVQGPKPAHLYDPYKMSHIQCHGETLGGTTYSDSTSW